MSFSRTRWPILGLAAVCVLAMLAIWSPDADAAASPFFTPARPSGSVVVKLHPTQVVPPGAATLVTFGVPMPRGSIAQARLNTVRVLKGGSEIPAYVDQMTPWRHATNSGHDGASVRVVRIQIDYTFNVSFPNSETITVTWGGANRTRSIADLRDVRTAWHRVTDGTTATGGLTYGAGDNVFEPDVYAALPKEWLAASGIKQPMLPTPDSIGSNRVPPSQVPSSMPGYLESDQAMVNFFHTIINEDDPLTGPVGDRNTNSFTTNAESWLYDRASVMYVGYLRTGYLRFLREAVRNTEFYRTKLWTAADCNGGRCVGSFKMKNPNASASWHDQKYSYNESLALSHWLTGDTRVIPHVEDVSKVYDDVNTVPNPNFYTERHTGLKLLANTVAYEVTGKATYRDSMLTVLGHLRTAQLNPMGGGPVDGGIWHSLAAHEGGGQDQPITSPWMSALIADAASRAMLVSEDPRIGPLLTGLANHECGVGSYWSTIRDGENPLREHTDDPVYLPHYLATRDGLGFTGEFNPWNDMEHTPDVAAVVAWGAYFAGLAGETQKQATLKQCANNLYTSWSHVITSWTRPSAPASNLDAYRVDPPRKYNWWFKNGGSFAWAMASGTGPRPAPTSSAPSTPTSTPSTSPPTCGTSRTTSVYNQTFQASSRFDIVVDATPNDVADTGVGVGSNPPVNEANSFSTAAMVRFNTANMRVEARDGSSYVPTSIPWIAGQRYVVRVSIDVPSHTYSAYVSRPGAPEQVLGTGLAFRSNYANVTSLNNLRGAVDGGYIRICPINLPS
jgi:hypothetical protein